MSMPALTEAIGSIPNLKLRREVKALLGELLMLAEGGTTSWEQQTSHGKPDSKSPRHAFKGREGEAPPADRSLWEHYSFRFARAAHAGNEVELRRLLIFADRELQDVRKRPDANRIQIQQERDEQADIRRLIEHGKGIPAGIISAQNRWPISWVRVQRERNGQDPNTGEERIVFGNLSDEERYEAIGALRDQGMSQREAAMKLGVGKGSVQRYWSREKVA